MGFTGEAAPAHAAAADRVVRTVCSHDCPDSCAVLVTVRTTTDQAGRAEERAIKVAGDPTHPVTRGFLCGKVARYLDRVYAPDRLLHPMRRRAGVAKGPLAQGQEQEAFERISWNEALDLAAARLGSIAAEFGPESVLPYSYAGTIGQLGYGSMDRRFFHRLGASQLDRTICAAAGGAALKAVYGVKLGTAPEDFAHAGLIIAWGANIHGNNVHLWPFVEKARRRGARLVVIDPYKTRTAALADEHIAIRPGTDGLLALGLMHVIFRMGLEDKAYLAECTAGHAELRAFALRPEHAPERVSQVTGVAATSIVRLAREYAQAGRGSVSRPAVIRVNYGVQRSENGGTAMRAIVMLPLITGSWKRQGGGMLMSTSGAFSFDEHALQRPDLMHASALGRPSRVVNMSQLGAALTTLGADGQEPPVKALVVYNSNPAAVAPNQAAVLAGMRRADLFTVVHEQFFTDTADYADLLLPAPTFLETKDVQGAYGHRFLQLSQQAIQPLGEARSNTWLFSRLARRMGFEEACFADSDDDLIDQALASGHPWLGGVTRQQLEQDGRYELHPGPLRGDHLPAETNALPFSTADCFETASGKAELLPVPAWVAPGESRANAGTAYPLEFLPRKADHYMNSTFANQAVHQRMERATAGLLEMHVDDAQARGVVAGDEVEIFNQRGRLRLRASLTGKVAPGVVAARLDWAKLQADGAGNVNQLTSERLTDLGGGATFYSTLVEVRRLNATAC